MLVNSATVTVYLQTNRTGCWHSFSFCWRKYVVIMMAMMRRIY